MVRIAIIFLIMATPLLMDAQNKTKPSISPKAEVFYFHPTERCPIDQAIEDNTRQTVKTDFSKEISSGRLKLSILNTDDKANEKAASKFDINTQALYVVRYVNGKEERTDLTTFAFDVAATNPQKFRVRLKDEIEAALK